MSDPLGKELYAAKNGRASEVSFLLRDHPEVDINWTNEYSWTALQVASRNGLAEVVKLPLAHSKIEVNLKDWSGQTPFSKGCEHGQVSVVEVLVKNPRVDVTQDDSLGCTPLWWASWKGKHEVIEWLVASGKDLGTLRTRKGNMMAKNTKPLKLQESSRTRLKLCRCWKGSWQTQHRPDMRFE